MHRPYDRSAVLLLLVSLLLGVESFTAATARADDDRCPSDHLALWRTGALHGANVFAGRTVDGASSGFGDDDYSQDDFDDLADAGANFVQISHAGIFSERPPYALDPDALKNLDSLVAMAARAHLAVGIAFRSGPGRNENAITARRDVLLETIWSSRAEQDAWVQMAAAAAEHFRGNPSVVGLSIMVEPNAYAHHHYPSPKDFYARYGGTLEDVNGLFARATAAVRRVNAELPLLLEPEGFGDIAWLDSLHVTGDPRTVYTPHDYLPFDYTNGIIEGSTYPGSYELDDDRKVLVDANYLRHALDPVRAFSAKHGVPVAITEFGVQTTANNAARYLHDKIRAQSTVGSWAIWVWQPAELDDPFSVHDRTAVSREVRAAWQENCEFLPFGNRA